MKGLAALSWHALPHFTAEGAMLCLKPRPT